jgi:hypothetical protein
MPITLTALSPDHLEAGGPPATIDVTGTGFDASCTVQADTIPRGTFFLDGTHLQYTARPDTETGASSHEITVTNTAGEISNVLVFSFTGPPSKATIAFWECPCGINISSSQPLPAAPVCICGRTMSPYGDAVPGVLFNVVKVPAQNQRNR